MSAPVNNKAPVAVPAPKTEPSASKGVISTALAAGVVAGLAGGLATGIVVALAAGAAGTVSTGLTGKAVGSVKNAPKAIGRAYTQRLGSETAKAKLAVILAQEKVSAVRAKAQLIRLTAARTEPALEAVGEEFQAAQAAVEQAKRKQTAAIAKAAAPGCLSRVLIRAGLKSTPQKAAIDKVEQAQAAVSLAEGNLNRRKAAIASVAISKEVAQAELAPLAKTLVKAQEDLLKAQAQLQAVAPAAK